jgi:signal peptidase
MAIAISVGITFFLGKSSHPTVAVTTGSMLPIYNGFQDSDREPDNDIYPFRGDILLVKKVPIESIEVGDVIVFETPSVPDPVVHRVVAKWQHNNEFIFKTNGDNNLIPDSWEVSGDKVFGIVVFRIPHIGWFLLVVQTTVGKIIILALAVIILFIGDDSEEDSPSNKKEQDIAKKNDNIGLTSKIINMGTKVIQNRSYFYTVLALLIIISFLGVNLLSSSVTSPSIKLYRIGDESRINNLIISPSTLSSRYEWEDYANQTFFFFPIQIEIRSGGIFNNIEKIEIRVNNTKGLYRWTTVYNFIGTRVFEGAIIAAMNNSVTSNVYVSVSMYSRGFFASSPQSFNFTLILQN